MTAELPCITTRGPLLLLELLRCRIGCFYELTGMLSPARAHNELKQLGSLRDGLILGGEPYLPVYGNRV